MTTAIDTNALLALLYDDAHTDASEAALRLAYQKERVVITPIVYAELAADGHFDTAAEPDVFLEDLSIQLVEPSRDALFEAEETFREYTERWADALQCPSCGGKQTVRCGDCDSYLSPRQHIAADFLIGGHATADADALASFDSGFYSTYFPSLPIRPE